MQKKYKGMGENKLLESKAKSNLVSLKLKGKITIKTSRLEYPQKSGALGRKCSWRIEHRWYAGEGVKEQGGSNGVRVGAGQREEAMEWGRLTSTKNYKTPGGNLLLQRFLKN